MKRTAILSDHWNHCVSAHTWPRALTQDQCCFNYSDQTGPAGFILSAILRICTHSRPSWHKTKSPTRHSAHTSSTQKKSCYHLYDRPEKVRDHKSGKPTWKTVGSYSQKRRKMYSSPPAKGQSSYK